MKKAVFVVTFLLILVSFTHSQKWKEPGIILKMPSKLYVGLGVGYTVEAVTNEPARGKNWYRRVFMHVSRFYAWHNIHCRVVYEWKWTKPMIPITTLVNDDSYGAALGPWRNLAISLHIPDASVMVLLYDKENQGRRRGVAITGDYRKVGATINNAGVIAQGRDTVGATNVAHEVGHALGLNHFEKGHCAFHSSECVMYPALTFLYDNIPNAFAAESIEALMKTNTLFLKYKLFSSPNLYPMCGNGFIDPGEECDCGFPENCILLNQSACCDSSTCKLKNNAECSFGECCENCKFKSGNVCRAKRDECDLEEKCNGYSANCPFDDSMPDGTSCRKNTSFCSQGKCSGFYEKCYTAYQWGQFFDSNCNNEYYTRVGRLCGGQTRGNLICNADEHLCSVLICAGGSSGDYGNSFYLSPGLCGFIGEFMPTLVNRDTSGLPCGKGLGCFGGRCVNASLNAIKCAKVRCPEQNECYMGSCVRIGAAKTACAKVKCKDKEGCGANGKCIPIPDTIPTKDSTRPTVGTTTTTTTPSNFNKKRAVRILSSSSWLIAIIVLHVIFILANIFFVGYNEYFHKGSLLIWH